MKSVRNTIFIGMVLMLISSAKLIAQCISPDLRFTNPVLVQGTDLSEGAVYKFSNVSPGVDCYIKLIKFNGGATLISMETPGQGYPDAWQPIIDGPGTPLGNKSWIDWGVSFKTTAGTNYAFPCLDISAIDVDGDNGNLGEFIEADGHASYHVPFPTLLTITDMGIGRIEAQGPTINRTGIDTLALDVRINYLYNGMDSIQLKIGQTVSGPGTGGATQRLNSIYFKRVSLTPFVILPVTFRSLDAMVNGKEVTLNWQTDKEVNHSHFEIERSFDGNNFNGIGKIINPEIINNTSRKYSYIDNTAVLDGKAIVYYRIRQVDANGKAGYSKVAMVRLGTNKGIKMQVTPNPFSNYITINFTSMENGPVQIRMRNIFGQTMFIKEVLANKGENMVKVQCQDNLSAGMYIAEIIQNEKVADTRKLMKE